MHRNTLLDLIAELHSLTDKIEAVVEASYQEKEATQVTTAPAKSQITIEQIRAILAEKSRAGKTAEVRDLLYSFDVTKLSEVKPEQFPELLKASEEL
jgi:hypothetical protein